MAWVKGQSGNPNGKPSGIISPRRREFLAKMDKTVNIGRLVEIAMELAEGIYVKEFVKTKEGKIEAKVYKTPPSEFAIKFLIEQYVGKAPTPIEVSGQLDSDVTTFTPEERAKRILELKKKLNDSKKRVR